MLTKIAFVCLVATAVADTMDADTDACDGIFEFDCGDGQCVSTGDVCDGTADCANGEDESIDAGCAAQLWCMGTHPASDTWCDDNCNHSPPNCPAEFCACYPGSRPAEVPTSGDNETASLSCVGTAPATDDWCNINCNNSPPYCPSLCDCGGDYGGMTGGTGVSTGRYTGTCVASGTATDAWCEQTCHNPSPFCPSTMCRCTDVPNTDTGATNGAGSAGTVSGNDISGFTFVSLVGGVTHEWCNLNCNHEPPHCPSTICRAAADK